MINVTAQGHDAAIKALANVSKNLTKEIGVASWKTAKYGKAQIAKEIQKEVTIPQKVIKKHISAKRLRQTMTQIVLEKSERIALKYFKPRQTRAGTAYKISKQQGRQRIDDAFMGPKPGAVARKLHGHVWIRAGKLDAGSSNPKRIIKLYGPSPFAVFVKNDNIDPMGKKILERFGKELNERLRYLRLKQSGVI